MYKKTISVAACLLTASPAFASLDCREDAMIVFDGSGSMAEIGFNDIDQPRIFDARRAIASAVPSIAEQRRLGLVIYGPGGSDECSGLDLRFTPVVDAAPLIIDAVESLQPAGDTALVEAVKLAAEVLEYRSKPGTIVLLTDGKETCGGLACQLAAELAGYDLSVHVIGFKIRGDFFDFGGQGNGGYAEASTVARCLADRTGGLYADTESVDELVDALNQTLGCTMISQNFYQLTD